MHEDMAKPFPFVPLATCYPNVWPASRNPHATHSDALANSLVTSLCLEIGDTSFGLSHFCVFLTFTCSTYEWHFLHMLSSGWSHQTHVARRAWGWSGFELQIRMLSPTSFSFGLWALCAQLDFFAIVNSSNSTCLFSSWKEFWLPAAPERSKTKTDWPPAAPRHFHEL